IDRIMLETKTIAGIDQAMNTHSELFSASNYGLIAYYKSAQWMKLLEKTMGADNFHRAMKAYYEKWKFKHPRPEDFRHAMEEASDKNLDSVFALINQKGILPGMERKGTEFNFYLRKGWVKEYQRNPPKNLISYGPIAGFNSYDKLMLGGMITNIKLPPSRFQFLAIPMYATGSKKFNGIGLAAYSFYPRGILERIDIGLSGSRFTRDKFEDTSANKLFFQFHKLVPGFRLTFRNKDPRKEML